MQGGWRGWPGPALLALLLGAPLAGCLDLGSGSPAQMLADYQDDLAHGRLAGVTLRFQFTGPGLYGEGSGRLDWRWAGNGTEVVSFQSEGAQAAGGGVAQLGCVPLGSGNVHWETVDLLRFAGGGSQLLARRDARVPCGVEVPRWLGLVPAPSASTVLPDPRPAEVMDALRLPGGILTGLGGKPHAWARYEAVTSHGVVAWNATLAGGRITDATVTSPGLTGTLHVQRGKQADLPVPVGARRVPASLAPVPRGDGVWRLEGSGSVPTSQVTARVFDALDATDCGLADGAVPATAQVVVRDGGDGTLDPGDTVELLGPHRGDFQLDLEDAWAGARLVPPCGDASQCPGSGIPAACLNLALNTLSSWMDIARPATPLHLEANLTFTSPPQPPRQPQAAPAQVNAWGYPVEHGTLRFTLDDDGAAQWRSADLDISQAFVHFEGLCRDGRAWASEGTWAEVHADAGCAKTLSWASPIHAPNVRQGSVQYLPGYNGSGLLRGDDGGRQVRFLVGRNGEPIRIRIVGPDASGEVRATHHPGTAPAPPADAPRRAGAAHGGWLALDGDVSQWLVSGLLGPPFPTADLALRLSDASNRTLVALPRPQTQQDATLSVYASDLVDNTYGLIILNWSGSPRQPRVELFDTWAGAPVTEDGWPRWD